MKMKMMKNGLVAPEGYDRLTPENKADLLNGCGPKGYLDFVPDTIYGLRITPACDIHDFSWYVCDATDEDFKLANRVFYQNICRIIDTKTKWKLVKRLRYVRAYNYYRAVDTVGAMLFWNMDRGGALTNRGVVALLGEESGITY